MRFALTVFGSTISPLFDSARRLTVAEVSDGAFSVVGQEDIAGLCLSRRIVLLGQLGVQALACGGISALCRNALSGRGIAVYPWVSGNVQEVLRMVAWRSGRHGRNGLTRVAVPTIGSGARARLAPSFRTCSHLIVAELPRGPRTAIAVGGGLGGTGGCHEFVRWVVEAEATVLVTGRCGPNALGLLAVAGVDVVLGAKGRVADVVDAYARGTPLGQGHALTGPGLETGRQGGDR